MDPIWCKLSLMLKYSSGVFDFLDHVCICPNNVC